MYEKMLIKKCPDKDIPVESLNLPVHHLFPPPPNIQILKLAILEVRGGGADHHENIHTRAIMYLSQPNLKE